MNPPHMFSYDGSRSAVGTQHSLCITLLPAFNRRRLEHSAMTIYEGMPKAVTTLTYVICQWGCGAGWVACPPGTCSCPIALPPWV